ncbi:MULTISPECIES: sodium-dependent transporter [unclassified Butyrivibrio]|uniref:sodium-dependent transporter n=1 Tax=unclassified Butyrivibrio TaxID=2639466 RepID=UPI000425E2B0|nr:MULTISPECIES: sodium-dependent transporter [unclassified Butyrivibrio]
MSNERGSFASRLGFIMVSAGCAIGIGNVWKFPYVTGANGGGIFVVFYLIFLIIMGIPVMTMELAIGRASGKSVVRGYQKLEKKGQPWHIHGWFSMIGCYLLMMYYTTVSGWMVDYFYKFASGSFSKIDTESVGDVFAEMISDPVEMGIFMILTVILGFAVLSLGIVDGLERVNKIMMSGLLALIIILAIHSLTLSGAAEGVKFYLLPDWKRAMDVGLGKVISAAMNQAFFTLSLGIGAIEIFGSYMSKEHTLTGEAIRICALDTFVAIISGLIIFPACFSYNVETSQGPSLIFITLPKVFMNMNMGRIWGTLFFIFMTFASFSTVIAVFENLVAFISDSFGLSRGKSILINGAFILIASFPCVLGYNVWSDLHIIGARDVLDSEDFIVSNILLPLGSLIFTLFCTSKYGWGFDKYLEETNTGSGKTMPAIYKSYFKFVLPILILIILIQGLVS